MEYNKDYFRSLLEKIIAPVRDYYSEECAGLYLGHTGVAYEDCTVPMEGFSRILWGLAPLWAGGDDISGFSEIYIKGFSAGADWRSKEFWGAIHHNDQKFVEFAAIAFAILIAPQKVWEPLSDEVKVRLVSYLSEINNHTVSDNNWQMFPVLVNLALKKVGAEYDKERIEFCLSRLEEFYLGGGWYKDGITEQRDYYVPFALHFYSLIYSKMCYDEDRERCELFRVRAAEFAKTFIYWFDCKGRALVYGRSLTYRFAQAAFWSACIYADVPVFNLGIIKGILVRHMEEWLSNPIFDNGGILTIGYRYPDLHMSESYNAPGSPYWSLKVFLLLAVDDKHPFWSSEPEPMPVLEETKLLPEAQMIIQHMGDSVTALTPGRIKYNYQVHEPEKYCKFAYSSEFGFSVPRSNINLEQSAPDSMLSFELDGYIFVRRICDNISVDKDKIISEWSPFKGINVITAIIPTKNGHIRQHRIISEYDCTVRDAGFAVSNTRDSGCVSFKNEEHAEVKNNISFCRVESNTGGEPEIIAPHPNTSLTYQKTLLPLITYQIKKGTTEIETVVTYM